MDTVSTHKHGKHRNDACCEQAQKEDSNWLGESMFRAAREHARRIGQFSIRLFMAILAALVALALVFFVGTANAADGEETTAAETTAPTGPSGITEFTISADCGNVYLDGYIAQASVPVQVLVHGEVYYNSTQSGGNFSLTVPIDPPVYGTNIPYSASVGIVVHGGSLSQCTAPTTAPTTTSGPADQCPNIQGVQEQVPDGLVIDENGDCVEPPVDQCPNLKGDQEEVPDGLIIDENGDCVEPPVTTAPTTTSGPADQCPNIDDVQVTVPDGFHVLEKGEYAGWCVENEPPQTTGASTTANQPTVKQPILAVPAFTYTQPSCGDPNLTASVSGDGVVAASVVVAPGEVKQLPVQGSDGYIVTNDGQMLSYQQVTNNFDPATACAVQTNTHVPSKDDCVVANPSGSDWQVDTNVVSLAADYVQDDSGWNPQGDFSTYGAGSGETGDGSAPSGFPYVPIGSVVVIVLAVGYACYRKTRTTGAYQYR